MRMLGQLREDGMWRFQLAEAPGESEMVPRAQMLIAKHDHQMVEERLAHGRETRIVELRKIDTGDFGADGGGDWRMSRAIGDMAMEGSSARRGVACCVHGATI